MLREWIDGVAETPARINSGRSKKLRHRLPSKDPEVLRKRRNSANRTLSILKAGLNRAYEYGYVDSNLAWSRVKKFRRVDPPIPCYLEKEQCRDLLSACPSDLHKLVVGALVSGCRVGELRRMIIGDFLADLKRLIIRDSKDGRPRHVSLSDEGTSFFNQLTANRASNVHMFLREEGRPWRKCTHHRPYRKACYAAGLDPKVNFHTLRHTYATHAAMAGIPLAVIAKQLGHSDTRMVEWHYAHFGNSYVDEVNQMKMPALVS
jgi:integrase